MWQILEASHNVDGINKLEDELKQKNRQLDMLKSDVEAMERVSKDQNNALESLGGKNKENSDKMYKLNLKVREAKQEAKQLKD
jgi:hypothetical protein